jgi:hypothetical protein
MIRLNRSLRRSAPLQVYWRRSLSRKIRSACAWIMKRVQKVAECWICIILLLLSRAIDKSGGRVIHHKVNDRCFVSGFPMGRRRHVQLRSAVINVVALSGKPSHHA